MCLQQTLDKVPMYNVQTPLYQVHLCMLLPLHASLSVFLCFFYTNLIVSMPFRYNEARALVKQGVPVDTCDAQGNTPLIISAREGHGRMVKLFVRKGANLEAHNIDGMSAEQLALSSGHIGIVEYLHESKIGVLLRR